MNSNLKSTYSTLMRSKFFNPAFNSAVFDGPFRIYFSQFHESLALKIYFHLQSFVAKEDYNLKEFQNQTGQSILILLYPNKESFGMSFDNDQNFICIENLEGDLVIGINGPFEDEKIHDVLNAVSSVLSAWKKQNVLREAVL